MTTSTMRGRERLAGLGILEGDAVNLTLTVPSSSVAGVATGATAEALILTSAGGTVVRAIRWEAIAVAQVEPATATHPAI